ncbi:hypothetical protein [Spirillospora sp. NBC_01491]|uniref:hypothetical protein n=1 Tax=Spirillospora sp. NBC_01491 TaxID=2976007 RepID=UPI002E35D5F0|nr:hypothetical protein [Spirillospora sp. NBC_01491]
MAHWLLPIATLTAVAAAATACGGGDGDGDTGQSRTGGRAASSDAGYTADQLEQALLFEVPGYRRAAEPDSGEYGTLKAIQNYDRLQRQVKLDKPRCANGGTGGPSAPLIGRGVPAALASFARKDGQTVTETLMAPPAGTAANQVKSRVPAGCLTFRSRLGEQWASHRVVESPPGRIGEGSRTVGVATTGADSYTRTWYVVMQGRRFLATVSVFGPKATRADAEDLARRSLAQAQRILP